VRHKTTVELDEEILAEILRTAYVAYYVFVDFVLLSQRLENSAARVLEVIRVEGGDLNIASWSEALRAVGCQSNFRRACATYDRFVLFG
jgi:hypothetical protein